jgi:hypothetical protein
MCVNLKRDHHSRMAKPLADHLHGTPASRSSLACCAGLWRLWLVEHQLNSLSIACPSVLVYPERTAKNLATVTVELLTPDPQGALRLRVPWWLPDHPSGRRKGRTKPNQSTGRDTGRLSRPGSASSFPVKLDTFRLASCGILPPDRYTEALC